MAYQKKPNPYLDADGRISPANAWKAREFTRSEDEQYLASLSAAERAEVLHQRRGLQEHMNVFVDGQKLS